MFNGLFVPFVVIRNGLALEIETRERVKASVDTVSMAVSGGKKFHEICAALLRGLEWAREHLQTADTEEKVNALLEGLEEPSPGQLIRWEAMARYVPAALNAMVRDRLASSSKTLPGVSMGRKAMPVAEKSAICDEVSLLTRNGCTLRVAKTRVAQRHGSTVRTVSRIWALRHEYSSITTPEEVERFVAALLHPHGSPGDGSNPAGPSIT